MSQFTEPRIVQAYMVRRVDGARQRAEEQALVHQARAHGPGKQPWRNRLVLHVGQGLITIGERLASYQLPPALALEEQGRSCRQAPP